VCKVYLTSQNLKDCVCSSKYSS